MEINIDQSAHMQDDVGNQANPPPLYHHDEELPHDIRHNIDWLQYIPDDSIKQYMDLFSNLTEESFLKWQKILLAKNKLATKIDKLNNMKNNNLILKSVKKLYAFDRLDNDLNDDFTDIVELETIATNRTMLSLILKVEQEKLDYVQNKFTNFNQECAISYWTTLGNYSLHFKMKKKITRELLTRDKVRQTFYITNLRHSKLVSDAKTKAKLDHEADLKQKALDDPETSIKLLIAKMLKLKTKDHTKVKKDSSPSNTFNCKQCTSKCNSAKQLSTHVSLKHSKNVSPVKGTKSTKNMNKKKTKSKNSSNGLAKSKKSKDEKTKNKLN